MKIGGIAVWSGGGGVVPGLGFILEQDTFKNTQLYELISRKKWHHLDRKTSEKILTGTLRNIKNY